MTAYPDVPLCAPEDPARDAELRVQASTVPTRRDAVRLSDWELLVERATSMERLLDANAYRAWIARQLECTLDGESAGYVPKMERCVNLYPAAVLPRMLASGGLSAFGTWVTSWLTHLRRLLVFASHVTILQASPACLTYTEKQPGALHFVMPAGPPSASKCSCCHALNACLSVAIAVRDTKDGEFEHMTRTTAQASTSSTR